MLLVLLSLSCTLSAYSYTPCTDNAECREAFGLGSVCGDQQLCTAMTSEPRCANTYPEDLLERPEEYPDVIVMGSLFNHDPEQGDLVETQAARLAVKQANDSEGLDGRSFAIVECGYEEDSELDALTMEEATVQTLLWMVDSLGITAVIGPATSGMMEAAWYGIAERADAPILISPSATSPALTTIDGDVKGPANPGLVWRTAPPDSLQGEALSIDITRSLGDADQSVAILYQIGPYGEGLADEFISNYADTTHTVDRWLFENDTQRDNAVNEVANLATPPQAILFISSDVSDVVKFMYAAGSRVESFLGIPIYLADAARDQELLTQTESESWAAELLPQVRGTAPAVPEGDVYESFAAAYTTTFQGQSADDSSYSAYSYDAAWLAIYGTAWSLAANGSITGLGIAGGLHQISDPDYTPELEIKPLNWGTVRTKFAASTAINVVGASGHLDYDDADEETTAPIDIWQVQDVDGLPLEAPHTWGFVTVDRIEP